MYEMRDTKVKIHLNIKYITSIIKKNL